MKASQVSYGSEIALPNTTSRLKITNGTVLREFILEYGDVEVVAKPQIGSIWLPIVYDVPAFEQSRKEAAERMLAFYEC